jgi:hypothetical protein
MYFQFIKKEIKLSLSMPCGHTGCIKAQLHSFLTSTLDTGGWPTSHIVYFIPRERVPGTHWIGDWVAFRVGLHIFGRGKPLVPTGNRTPYHPVLEKIRLQMSSQGLTPVWVSWDLSQPLGSLDETYKTSSIAGWLTSNGQDGEVLTIPRCRLGN